MIRDRIRKLFGVQIDTSTDGTVVIPPAVFIKNKDAIEQIKKLITDESNKAGMPFYFSTVSTTGGIQVSWSTRYLDCLPDLSQEEELLGDGLVYIVRRVG